VIKFIQEDMANLNIPELDELFLNINMLEYTLKFFRGLYTSFNSDLSHCIRSLFKLKNISLVDEEEVLEETACTRISNIICGILYIVMKACKEGDVVSIESQGLQGYSMSVNRELSFPQSVINTFNDSNIGTDVFNVLCKYLNDLASDEWGSISVGRTKDDHPEITVSFRRR
jgi:hypothetical protein